jgi:hypothetical protein
VDKEVDKGSLAIAGSKSASTSAIFSSLKPLEGKKWAISPDDSDEILALESEKEFALVVDLSGNPANN